MELISKADVVLALGTRLNPFSTLPGYGIDYWPKDAKIIQVDINPDRIGLTKKVTVGIVGDAPRWPTGSSPSCRHGRRRGREERKRAIARPNRAWAQQLSSMDHEDDDPGTTWNERARDRQARLDEPAHGVARHPVGAAARGDHLVRHRQQLRHRQRLSDLRAGPQIPRAGPVRPLRLRPAVHRRRQDRLPGHAGGGLCRRRRLRHRGERTDGHRRGEWPPITMVVFRNYQWGAEKRNSTLWFDDNFVGTELDDGRPTPDRGRPAG
jgi:sulfoacetaldehyde acetyltransferase